MSRVGLHDGDAVLLVARIPGLDGAPGELARVAVLVGEAHLADGLDAGLDGVARRAVDGAEHPHFKVGRWISHNGFLLLLVFSFGPALWPVTRRRVKGRPPVGG